MDTLGSVLDGPRARGAFLLRTVLDPPWSLRVEDRAAVTVLAPTKGRAWLVPDDAEPARLDVGEVAVVRGPDPYTVASTPDLAPTVVVQPGQRTTTPTGDALCDSWSRGVRTWGTGADGRDILLVGVYEARGEVGSRVLSTLPPRLVLPQQAGQAPLLALLEAELDRDEPGQGIVLDRLLDLVLVSVLRAWFTRPDGEVPQWVRAQADPVVGQALRLLHDDPAFAWTVSALADRVGVSRAALARRFAELVGEPPMTYLTGWRLALAADLLRNPAITLAAIARRVGYGTPFALSTAFKRAYGVSPNQYRSAHPA